MGGKTIIIAWELKKIYTSDDITEMIIDFYNNYKEYLDYPTREEYIKECYNNSNENQYITGEEAYHEYLFDEFDSFVYSNEDLYTIETIEI